jgi:SOS-response transcriptional repressor LexA
VKTGPLQERVRAVLQEQGLKQTDLAKVTGRSRALVNLWVNGPAESMDYEAAVKIGVKYGYSVDWLMLGKGPKTSKGRTPGQRNVSPGPDTNRKAPLISWVQAGRFTEPAAVHQVSEDEVRGYFMPKRGGENVYCLRVEGDSMTSPYGRSYPAGCIIFVDPDQRTPNNGARVIAKLNGTSEVTFKTFVTEAGHSFLKPLNPQYPPISAPFRILGTVIGKWEDD